MKKKLEIGTVFHAQTTVEATDLASHRGSGRASVYSTPMMILLMESTCNQHLGDYLEDGYISVGAAINIKHLRPTPLGATVRCEATYVGQEGKLLKFECNVWDEVELIGSGYQLRGIVSQAAIEQRANDKSKAQ